MKIKSVVTAALFVLACSGAAFGGVLTNGGFETGDLTGWTQDYSNGGGGWSVISSGCYDGTYCATDYGNVGLVQTFTGVDVSTISDISFYYQSPGGGPQAVAVDLIYSGVHDETVYASSDTNWDLIDVTSQLRGSGTLTGIEIYGNSGGTALLDDVSIATGSAAPEPGTLGMLLGGLGVGFAAIRRKRS